MELLESADRWEQSKHVKVWTFTFASGFFSSLIGVCLPFQTLKKKLKIGILSTEAIALSNQGSAIFSCFIINVCHAQYTLCNLVVQRIYKEAQSKSIIQFTINIDNRLVFFGRENAHKNSILAIERLQRVNYNI
jgi:hypothetical protein